MYVQAFVYMIEFVFLPLVCTLKVVSEWVLALRYHKQLGSNRFIVRTGLTREGLWVHNGSWSHGKDYLGEGYQSNEQQ